MMSYSSRGHFAEIEEYAAREAHDWAQRIAAAKDADERALIIGARRAPDLERVLAARTERRRQEESRRTVRADDQTDRRKRAKAAYRIKTKGRLI